MLVGFLEPGHNLYCGDDARRVFPNDNRLIQREQDAGSRAFLICDSHDPDDPEFQMFPVHCVGGTDEASIIPELSGYEGEMIPKRRYSGFFSSKCLFDILGQKHGQR